jgi:putative two-component system response regulator
MDGAMKTIFVVDDNNANLIVAEKALSDHYNVFTLPSAEAMFEFLGDILPDLILLDVKMPKTNGLDALKMLKASTEYASIPVVFLTGRSDPDTETLGFELGAIDYISKPFSRQVLLSRINTHLNIEKLIRERTAMLFERTEHLQKLKNSIVSVLANMVENRDKMTGCHISRTTRYIKLLMNAMIAQNVYAGEMADWDLDMLVSSARLHDIGKIMITDTVLNKPGRLTHEEFEVIKTHSLEGERIIDEIVAESGDEDFLRNARLFAGSHHEWWDGSGYPRGLKGTQIPLQGRIMAIVDVYDALISDRPYKKAFPHSESVRIIEEGKGIQFDPDIASVFLEVSHLFEEVPVCQQ